MRYDGSISGRCILKEFYTEQKYVGDNDWINLNIKLNIYALLSYTVTFFTVEFS